MALSANRARFVLAVAGCDDELRVLRLSGEEALSRPFAFRIEVICRNPALDLKALLQCDALLQIDTAGPALQRPRLLHGSLCRVEQLVTGKRWSHYQLHLAPRLAWLGWRHNVRIFQEQSVPDIVRQLLRDAGLDASLYRFELTRAYPPLSYCVQYNESDLDFMQRLLAQAGIHYHFEHQEAQHVAVFADHAEAFRHLEPRELAFRADAQMVGEPVINELRQSARQGIGRVVRTDYDFRKPQLSQWVQTGEVGNDGEHFAWPGGYDNPDQGRQVVNDYLVQAQIGQQGAQGASVIPQLGTGRVFQMTQHPRADFNREWLVLGLQHQASQPQVLEEEVPENQGSTYSNRFEVMPADQVYRPPQCWPKPRVRGVQTAVVVGPPGETIYTDQYGRIQVCFHWDRENRNSCWLRLSQGWADHHWGSVVLPRVGQEVVVTFLHDDPDQPVVSGCLYHGLHKPPYPLPEHASRSVLRSQSLSGKGGHELMLEDRAGQERIAIHSARDFELHVTQDARTDIERHAHAHIGSDELTLIEGLEHLQVQGERRVKVDGQDSLAVGASRHLKAGTAIHQQAGQAIHLKAGGQIAIDAGMELTLKGGGSSLTLNPAGVYLQGPLINLNSGGGAGSAVAASPKAPAPPVQIGGRKAGAKGSPPTARQARDDKSFEFTPLQGVTATAAAAESEILSLLQQSVSDAPPGQLQTLLSLLNDAAQKDPDVGRILALEGSEGKGIIKRWSNSGTGELLFPTELTQAEEQGLLSKFRSLYGGNDTVQNALDIHAYNEKPLFGSDAISHGDVSDTTEIAALAAGIVGLLKYAPQFAAKVKRLGLEDVPWGSRSHAKYLDLAAGRRELKQSLLDRIGRDFKSNPLRIEYETEVAALSRYADRLKPDMTLAEKKDLAYEANEARRQLGVRFKDATPEPLRDYIYQVNEKRYGGDHLGPTVEFLVEQKGKTYSDIIQSSSRPNPDIDKLLSGFSEWLESQPEEYLRKHALRGD